MSSQNNYPDEFKEYFDEIIYNILINLVQNNIPFQIAMLNTDNWSIPLSENIKAQKMMIIKLADQSLEDTYFDENEKLVFISTGFNGEQATKYVTPNEILALIDVTTGQPFIVRPYTSEKKVEKVKYSENSKNSKNSNKSIEKLVQGIVDDGINEPQARKSVEAFIKNNPELAEEFK